jgi:hypothetical protein
MERQMPQTGNQARYCFIDRQGGSVAIKFSVSKSLVAGADFKLFQENLKDVKESWKMSADDGMYTLRTIRTVTSELHKKSLVWQVLCCSTDISVFTGGIEISVVQNNNECKMTAPATYNLPNIPPCSLNNPVSASGHLTFILKS